MTNPSPSLELLAASSSTVHQPLADELDAFALIELARSGHVAPHGLRVYLAVGMMATYLLIACAPHLAAKYCFRFADDLLRDRPWR